MSHIRVSHPSSSRWQETCTDTSHKEKCSNGFMDVIPTRYSMFVFHTNSPRSQNRTFGLKSNILCSAKRQTKYPNWRHGSFGCSYRIFWLSWQWFYWTSCLWKSFTSPTESPRAATLNQTGLRRLDTARNQSGSITWDRWRPSSMTTGGYRREVIHSASGFKGQQPESSGPLAATENSNRQQHFFSVYIV